MSKVRFHVASFQELLEPVGDIKKYNLLVPFDSLPVNLPTEGNPRKQNMNTKVAKQIINEIRMNQKGSFHLLNRGMLVLAKELEYFPDTEEVELTFSDPIQGVVDGGHTYRAVTENKNYVAAKQHVTVEVIVNADEIFASLAKTRNTSQQVETKALLEIEGKFDVIKEAIFKQPYAENVVYKTNSEGFIDVIQIVQIVSLFNIDRFNDKNAPTSSYRNRNNVALDYERDLSKGEHSFFLRAKKLIPDILKLYDHMERNLPEVFNKQGHRFSKLSGVKYNSGNKIYRRKFSNNKMMAYEIPFTIMFPLIASFRVFVRLNPRTKMFEWIDDLNICKVFDDIANDLIADYYLHYEENKGYVADMVRKSLVWRDLYKRVQDNYYKYVDEVREAERKFVMAGN